MYLILAGVEAEPREGGGNEKNMSHWNDWISVESADLECTFYLTALDNSPQERLGAGAEGQGEKEDLYRRLWASS